ncbi:hypothetical protein C7N43_05130 [Sphingobacteriales bacterium UPWRP_1]|nr:hypothetical protein BVG80_09620 [Sphingobacteriales bacterium TSM_CSM]PSJ78141.1 hypothetical protein C7N43_05130 [Sphingobacteriales bacterium UPWRP_1]
MTIDELRTICTSFPSVTEEVKWGHDLCFCIAGKMFVVADIYALPFPVSFKVPAEEFEVLLEKPGFEPAPYLARHCWIRVKDLNRLDEAECRFYAHQSYRLVAEKLPAKIRKTLQIEW